VARGCVSYLSVHCLRIIRSPVPILTLLPPLLPLPPLLAVLSGKELFNFNKDLFVDDDGAMDAAEERTFNAETELRRVKEEAQAEAEAQRIRAEQERLSELQRVEFEVRLSKEVDRRVAAAAKGRATFMMGEVQINQVVFEDDEEEDLALYPEEQLFEAEVREAVVITPMDVEEEEMDCVEEGEEGEEEEGEEDSDEEEEEEEEEGPDGEAEEA